MLLLILSLLLFLLIALQVNRYFHYKRWLDWFIGGILFLMATIILVMTLSGLVYQMNNPLFVLSFQVVLLVLVYLVAKFVWQPKEPMFPHAIQKLNFKEYGLSLPVLVFIFTSLGVALLNLIYVLFVPPNNNDSLALHLARIGMWHQTGSWLPWNTKVIWQLTFPMNAELISYWTLLFTKSEHLLGMVTYICGYLSVVLIYQLGRELSDKKSLALFGALVWAAMPVVQLNFTSTRHDHASSFMLLAAVYFFYQHLKEKNKGYLILSGLAIGLSIGTNFSVAGYLPGLALFFLLYWLAFKKICFRDVVTLASSALIAFLIFSSPVFISNAVHFGSLLGPEAIQMTSQNSIQKETSVLEHTALMSGRWAYQIVDFQGIPEPYLSKMMQIKALIPDWVAEKTGLSLEANKSLLNQHVFGYSDHIPFSEDSAWFGLVGTLIFFIVSIYILFIAIHKKQPLMVLAGLFILSVPLAYAFLRSGWTPYDGRYFITLFAFLSLGLVPLLDDLKPILRTLLIYIFTLVSIITLVISIYGNPAKAFWGYRAFWNQHRFDSISAQSYDTKEMIYLVDQTVPEDGVLGIATQATVYYEYGLFGEHFSRTIVPIYPDDKVCDATWLTEHKIEFILVDAGISGYPPCSLGEYEAVKSMKNWIVFKIK